LTRVVVFVAVGFALLLFVWNWQRTEAAKSAASPHSQSISPNSSGHFAPASVALEPGRLFPYSVIPGGVRSAEELKNALRNDPLAARHYAGFGVAKAHVIRLDRGQLVYVSYRLDNHIYWTSKRLWLPEGETVLTDGENEARTRCGNRISETPRLPVALAEPPQAMLDTPVPPELAAASEPVPVLPFGAVHPGAPFSALGPTDPIGGQIFIPPFIPIFGGSGTPSTDTLPDGPGQPPVTPTPEPMSLVLLSAGLLGIWTSRKKLPR
jgi:hypothetical protein